MIRNFVKYALTGSLLLVAGIVPTASATTLSTLQDWCVDVNGNTSNCNVGNPVGVSGGFDFTLGSQTEGAPATTYAGAGAYNDQNTLGAFSVVLSAGNAQYVAMYLDYDLNANGSGSFQDYAATGGGAAPTGLSWEINDPFSSNIYYTPSITPGDFFNNTLSNTNSVPSYSLLGGCCDVSWALALNLDVAAGTQDTVTFTVSDTAPVSGFYLQQTNGVDTTQNIYYSANVTTADVVGGSSPEPASFLLIGGGLAAAFFVRKRMAKA